MTESNALFLYLIGCALHESEPEEALLADADWGRLLALAKKHSLSSLVGYAIEKTAAFAEADPEIRKAWREAKEKAVRKTLLLDTERAALLSEFEKQQIWYMPLKGVILKDAYPRFGMREMSDNDILFDAQKRAQVKAIFKKRGYTVISYNHSNHDVYTKAPVLEFEMHTALFHPDVYPQLAAKYENVSGMLIPDAGNSYGRHLSDEEYYVYFLAHAYKHYSCSGTGLRTLTDIYVLQQLGKGLDRRYVDRELASLGVLAYEQESRSLAEKLFGSPVRLSELALSDAEREMLAFYLGAGTYGTIDNLVKKRLSDASAGSETITQQKKAAYLLRRVFPGLDFCKVHFPVVYRYPVLLPFFWVWRILVRAPKRAAALKNEVRAVRETK